MSKQEIVTFKVEDSLMAALAAIPNRSEFIRNAVKTALENICPVCQGTGVLSVEQKKHWERFSRRHSLIKCGTCGAFHIVCQNEGDARLEAEEDSDHAH